ncbi:MAG: transcription antitermination factor NusB [Treponemataceae bacterium]
MASRRKGRILAFQALYSWEATKPPVSQLLEFQWLDPDKRVSLDESVVAFARYLISGTIESIDAVDALIKKHLKNWDFSRLNRVDLAVLRMSVFALLHQEEVPASIVIDEAVDISKEFGTDDSYRFVNGVLDAIRKSLIVPGSAG